MSAGLPEAQPAGFGAAQRGGDPASLLVLLGALVLLVLPTYWDMTFGRWESFSQGHEWLVLGVSAWLVHRRADELIELPAPVSRRLGLLLLGCGLAAYVFGRSLEFIRIEMLSLTVVVAGLLAWWKGARAVRLCWFALFFMLFALPLPFAAVLALTAPLKTGVSVVATELLSLAGYPMGRSGVVITIGQSDLLVTEACAGLQTMFTLEALGLLYAHMRNHPSLRHNIWLSIMVVPVSFVSNVIRVVILVLVTYYFGDAAGQGFVHGFAGMVLFIVGLMLIVSVDQVLAAFFKRRAVR